MAHMNAHTISTISPAADFASARNEKIARQIRARGIRSLLDAMAAVPRREFVPPESEASSYSGEPLPIGGGQTISQSFMVTAMADAALLNGSERVLEIGAGSGYQAAVLFLLAHEVVVVELQSELPRACRERLAHLGYSNVLFEKGDGSLGRPPHAPYDAIVVSAAAPAVPGPLVEQLAEGGRAFFVCRFVHLLGRHGWPADPQQPDPGIPRE
jgi:protein-L-isoaspartate(D-aspartate) O-methyltransferase